MLPIKRLQLEDLDKIVLQVFLQLQGYLVAKSVLGVRFCVSPILISNKINFKLWYRETHVVLSSRAAVINQFGLSIVAYP
jgi:hypothetical protein